MNSCYLRSSWSNTRNIMNVRRQGQKPMFRNLTLKINMLEIFFIFLFCFISLDSLYFQYVPFLIENVYYS